MGAHRLLPAVRLAQLVVRLVEGAGTKPRKMRSLYMEALLGGNERCVGGQGGARGWLAFARHARSSDIANLRSAGAGLRVRCHGRRPALWGSGIHPVGGYTGSGPDGEAEQQKP